MRRAGFHGDYLKAKDVYFFWIIYIYTQEIPECLTEFIFASVT